MHKAVVGLLICHCNVVLYSYDRHDHRSVVYQHAINDISYSRYLEYEVYQIKNVTF